MNDFLLPAVLLAGLLGGGVIAWMFARNRAASLVEAAVSRAQVPLQTELAQLRERVRLGDEGRQELQSNLLHLSQQSEVWRGDLDASRDETARLSERATRVLPLENEVAALDEKLRLSAAEVLRLSSDAAQKGQAVVSLTDQIQQLEAENATLGQRLDASTIALNAAMERRATLEEQAVRLPVLEEKRGQAEQQLVEVTAVLSELRETSGAQLSRLNAELSAEREALTLVRNDLVVSRGARETADAEVLKLTGELTELRTRLDTEREAGTEKIAMLLEAKESLTDQFKTLANDILEEKSKRFAEQNQANLGHLLDPLRTQISEFKGKVEEVYFQEGKDRSALSEQVKQLVGLNQKLSEDAKNLTLALKGSAKAQGNWGELVLERVLEASGLRRGHEYHVQESQQREDGSRAQPDVVIDLPEERRLVVDAKVSLVAYEEHIVADSDDDRALAIKRHLDSVRTHIKGLSGKQYQALYGLKSLDFVLMFIPIEPAFMLAVTHDSNLFMDAWERNVLLVSPSTLLFVVRTVAHLWRQEQQSRNAQDIAKRGAELYDRLVGFVEDLQAVGTRLGQAQTAFETAQRKLAVGKGNVIRQAEMLKGMGVKPSKALPSALVDLDGGDDGLIVVPGLSPARLALDIGPEALQAKHSTDGPDA